MSSISADTLASVPDQAGRFGEYGGRYVSETLMAALEELDTLYTRLAGDPDFQRESRGKSLE